MQETGPSWTLCPFFLPSSSGRPGFVADQKEGGGGVRDIPGPGAPAASLSLFLSTWPGDGHRAPRRWWAHELRIGIPGRACILVAPPADSHAFLQKNGAVMVLVVAPVWVYDTGKQ